MNWETLIAIIGAVGGATGLIELIKYLATRKAHLREAESQADMAAINVDSEEWRIWKDQLDHMNVQIDRMNTQIEKKDERIEKLNLQLAQKEGKFQEQIDRYIEQTKRLRESQDREHQTNINNQRLSEQVTELTKESGELKLFIEEQQCRKLPCPFRQPRNRHTRKVLAELGIDVDIESLPEEDPELNTIDYETETTDG